MKFGLGRLWGIPIEVHGSWFIILALLIYGIGISYLSRVFPGLDMISALLMGAATAVVFFSSLLLHEMAHAVAARHSGIVVPGITLFLFGGVLHIKSEPDNWHQELGIALAGPAASALLAAVFYLAAWTVGIDSVVGAAAFYLCAANLILAAVNLLPGFPLDGGRAVRALIWAVTNRRIATRAATIAGEIVGAGLAATGVVLAALGDLNGLWLVLVGWFVADAAAQSWRQETLREWLAGVGAAALVTRNAVALSPEERVSRVAGGSPEAADVYPVIDGERVVGVITRGRAESVPALLRHEMRIGDVMQPPDANLTAGPSENAWGVVERVYEQTQAKGILVTDGSSVFGVVDRRELPGLLDSHC